VIKIVETRKTSVMQ